MHTQVRLQCKTVGFAIKISRHPLCETNRHRKDALLPLNKMKETGEIHPGNELGGS